MSNAVTQTSITELPDWAKDYGPQLLGLAEAVAFQKQFNPETGKYDITGPAQYQTYDRQRVAEFSPLQEAAYGRAGAMETSPQLGAATTAAQDVTGRAMGTSYDPYQMGQFTAGTAQQYMNPYLEAAMEPQLREAQRTSEIQRTADQAQAVRSGAFGGSRQAIVEAERQRNLGTQMGDIRARGYQSAFDQAQQNFAREQQLREQSRQYGAGLGMQGLGLGLQGAGLLGQLGQTQFGQGRDIAQLQGQFGTQQQQNRQRLLDTQYQDFLNQQRFPYQQLEFFGNMLRGTPMGTVQSMYSPPPSAIGQVAGLGIGLGGLSQLGRFFKDGGQVDGYADGGSVTDEDNVEAIIDRLSDAQLAQAKQAAMARRDMARLQAITEEEAMRASEREGMASAFNQLPQNTQGRMVRAAGGGILAFSDGGVSPEFGGGQGEGPSVNPLDFGRFVRGGKSIEEYYGEPAFGRAAPSPSSDSISAAFADESRKSDVVPRTRAEKKAKPRASAPSAPSASISQAAAQLADRAGVDKETFLDKFKQLREEFNASSKEEMKSLLAEAEKSMGGSKEVKERALGEALAKFGFQMAAAASKPGATLLGSASAASPALAASMAESAKLAREINQNDMKLRLSLKQFEIAQRKGDMQTAAALAGQIRALEQSQAQLGLQREQLAEQTRSNRARENIAAQRATAGSSGAQKAYMAGMVRAQDRAARIAKDNWGNIAVQQDLKKQGFTSFDQYYDSLIRKEMKRAVPIYGVAPDDRSDSDED